MVVMISGEKGISTVRRQQEIFDAEYSRPETDGKENWRSSYQARVFSNLALSVSACRGELSYFLDVGTGGTGHLVIEAAREGHYGIGIDVSFIGLRTARGYAKEELGGNHGKTSFVMCTAEQLPFKTAAFHGIACVAILEHVMEDGHALEEMARVLKPRGKAYIVVPNAYSRISPVLRPYYRAHDRKVGHLRHYSEEELSARLQASELSRVQVAYTGHWPKVIQVLLGLIWPRFGRTPSKLWWILERLDERCPAARTGLQLHVTVERES